MPAAPHSIPHSTTSLHEVFPLQAALISPKGCSTPEQEAVSTLASPHFQYEAVIRFFGQ